MRESYMDEDRIGIKRHWPDYEVLEILGKGANGKVYKIRRNHLNVVTYSAVKVIHIPSDDMVKTTLSSEGLTTQQIKQYYKEVVDKFLSENTILERLKGASNIVFIEDCAVDQKVNEEGYIIYIKMELLESLSNIMAKHQVGAKDVVKIGLDICDALVVCEERNIVHRDIKPENIFVNEFGTYKLGDFGTARHMDHTKTNMTQVGTGMYIAPELYQAKASDKRVDIYSLGIVLYRLANGGRFPFTDNDDSISAVGRQDALIRRLSGEQLPLPSKVDAELGRIIVKACAHNPEDRYHSAVELKQALEYWKYNQTFSRGTSNTMPMQMNVLEERNFSNNKKSKWPIVAGCFCLVAVATVGMTIAALTLNGSNEKMDRKDVDVATITEQKVEDVSIEATTEAPEEATTEELPEAPEDDYTIVSMEDASVGDIVRFGDYEQDSNISNGKEPIEWQVLDKSNGRVLLISRYVLDTKKYNEKYSKVSWEECTLRNWLNSTFLESAFSANERARIQYTEVSASDNPNYNTDQGSSVNDKVFLLSCNELERYFTSKGSRKCKSTPYAVQQGGFQEESWWWLRTLGFSEDCAVRVDHEGSIGYHGYYVNLDYLGVRPAIWVELE